jgi:hypothetical protein
LSFSISIHLWIFTQAVVNNLNYPTRIVFFGKKLATSIVLSAVLASTVSASPMYRKPGNGSKNPIVKSEITKIKEVTLHKLPPPPPKKVLHKIPPPPGGRAPTKTWVVLLLSWNGVALGLTGNLYSDPRRDQEVD